MTTTTCVQLLPKVMINYLQQSCSFTSNRHALLRIVTKSRHCVPSSMVTQRVHSSSSLHARGLDPLCLLLYFRSTLPTNLLFVLQTAKYRVETIPAGVLRGPLLHQNYFLIVYTDGALPSSDDD